MHAESTSLRDEIEKLGRDANPTFIGEALIDLLALIADENPDECDRLYRRQAQFIAENTNPLTEDEVRAQNRLFEIAEGE